MWTCAHVYISTSKSETFCRLTCVVYPRFYYFYSSVSSPKTCQYAKWLLAPTVVFCVLNICWLRVCTQSLSGPILCSSSCLHDSPGSNPSMFYRVIILSSAIVIYSLPDAPRPSSPHPFQHPPLIAKRSIPYINNCWVLDIPNVNSVISGVLHQTGWAWSSTLNCLTCKGVAIFIISSWS